MHHMLKINILFRYNHANICELVQDFKVTETSIDIIYFTHLRINAILDTHLKLFFLSTEYVLGKLNRLHCTSRKSFVVSSLDESNRKDLSSCPTLADWHKWKLLQTLWSREFPSWKLDCRSSNSI